ncbi:MAG: hypothetical protein JWS10_2109 [Cypionkella sp.]|uniref:GGDEF domain-containing protein n=1 Tax=Cypionkella sp. TaxID=2811411 RepID=UPI0026305C9C|nr:GGDEF domain-containing protein [Cypionkella sp.]MDB5659494.1 hypothetical protein [Cypionkella sp.]
MPMHVGLDAAGLITSVGPTLAKLIEGPLPLKVAFLKVFEVRRPAGITSIETLRERAGARLHVNLRGKGDAFRGLAVPTQGGGILLNLSFGIRLIDAVRQHALTDADFAPTDMAVEMLYLVEVKQAVMTELRRLNLSLQGAKATAEQQALTDTLTGLRNRRALQMALPALIAQGVDFALMHIDLDYFKQVNDNFGHAAGDVVLRAVADALAVETRASDTLARVGGDEFVVLLPGLSDTTRLAQIARRIIDQVMQPIEFESTTCCISASIGLTISTLYDGPDAARMLCDADNALYAAKRAGRAQVKFYQPHIDLSAVTDDLKTA